VWCWALDPQIASIFDVTPTKLELPTGVALGGDSLHACVLHDSKVTCEELYDGWSDPFTISTWAPRPVDYVKLTGGWAGIFCTVDAAGKTDCGYPNSAPNAQYFTFDGGPLITEITNGENHVCVLRSGHVLCAGVDLQPPDVLQGASTTTALVEIAGFEEPISKISSGKAFACALGLSGAVYCWGDNTFGQLAAGEGPGDLPSTSTPRRVDGLPSDVVQIRGNYTHTCAITSNHRIFCWGQFLCSSRYAPIELTSYFPGSVSSVYPGRGLFCAILHGSEGVECTYVPDTTAADDRLCTDSITTSVHISGL
jgi:hypothetical protein